MCRLVLARLLVINEGAAAFYSSGWIIFPLNTTSYSGVLHISLVFFNFVQLQFYFFLRQ